MADQKQRWAARADKLMAWADKAEAQAAAIVAAFPAHARDIAFLTQPGRSSSKVACDRRRLNDRDQRANALRTKAASFRDRAASLRRLSETNAGDAAKQREAKRSVLAVIQPGVLVSSVYGVRRVLKVNTKSLRLEGALGPITIDKSLCRLVSAQEA